MATEVVMPQMGESIAEGTITVSYTHLTLPTSDLV